MPTFSEEFESKARSFRINSGIIEACEETGVAITSVLEACLGRFLMEDAHEQVRTLTVFDPYVLGVSGVLHRQTNPGKRALKLARQQLGSKADSLPQKTLLRIGLLRVETQDESEQIRIFATRELRSEE